jgi:hypothetical protein
LDARLHGRNPCNKEERKLRQNRKYSHTAWLMISTGQRWFLYRVVAGEVSMEHLCHTVWRSDKLEIRQVGRKRAGHRAELGLQVPGVRQAKLTPPQSA